MKKFISLILAIVIAFCLLTACQRSIDRNRVIPRSQNYIYKASGLAGFAASLEGMSDEKMEEAASQYIQNHPQTPVIESDSVFSLYWYGKASQVLVNGDLQNGWALPDTMLYVGVAEKKFFFISYKVPSDIRIDYTLNIDSLMTLDPGNPVITPGGYGNHSQVAMPDFKPDPLMFYREAAAHGHLDSLDFTSSDTIIIPRNLKVYIPSGYDILTDLPVIYIMDGLEALDFMFYQNVLDNLIDQAKIVPILAVFIPPGANFLEKIGERRTSFLNAVCDEMVPLIDSVYKTAKHPSGRAIAGISAGGHFALWALFSRNDIFRNAAGQSPTLSDAIFYEMREMVIQEKYDQGMKVYFDCGIFDLPGGSIDDLSFLEANRKLNKELDQNQVNHLYREFNDGHQWANWRERTDDILIYFFKNK